MAIRSNRLVCTGGRSTPTWGDPRYFLNNAIARTPGRLFLTSIKLPQFSKLLQTGFFSSTAAGGWGQNAFYLNGSLWALDNGVGLFLNYPTDNTEYQWAVVLRASGAFYFVKGGGFTTWTLLWVSTTGAVATLYAGLQNYNAAFELDDFRIPALPWLPTPLVSDSFNRADGALGLTDGSGHPEANGGGAQTWTGSTYSIASNAALNTPTLSAEQLTNGTFELFTSGLANGWTKVNGTPTCTQETSIIHGGASSQKIVAVASSYGGVSQSKTLTAGTWVRAECYNYCAAGTWSAFLSSLNNWETWTPSANWNRYLTTARWPGTDALVSAASGSADATGYVDDATLKTLTLSNLFASVSTSTPDVVVEVALTVPYHCQAGLVLNLDSTSNPQNFVIVYLERFSGSTYYVKLDKCVGGVYSNLASGSVTYAAGKILRVCKYGTAYLVVYDGIRPFAGGSSAVTVSDAAIINNARHGLFSTDPTNTLENFVLFPRGTSNEYAALDEV